MNSLVFTFLLCLQNIVTPAALTHVHQTRAADFLSTTDKRTLPYIENRNIDTPSLDSTYRQSQSRQNELVKEERSTTGEIIEQWVSSVPRFSSQYDSRYLASKVIGKPIVYPRYGDIPGTWAQRTRDAKQFIEVEFKHAIYIQKIDIYETFHAGGVKKISAKKSNTQNTYEVIWQTKSVTDLKSSRIFSPNFKRLSFPCKVLRIDVDCTASKSWVEIDAVKITGKKHISLPLSKPKRIEQWVSKVKSYSSQYSDKKWSASKVIGPPNVYPRYGDISEAWAQKSRNAHQYIKVSFPKKTYIEKINIYETFHAGGVSSVYVKNPKGKLIKIWQTNAVSNIESSRIFSPTFTKLVFPCNEILVKVNCTGTGPSHYVEIDAIKIIGTTEPGTETEQVSYEHPMCKPYQQWVSRVVKFSSQYDVTKWPAKSVIGKPTVYPKYGDIRGTWAQKIKDSKQFIEVEFKQAIYIQKIDIYETYHTGGVKTISAKKPNTDKYEVIWQTKSVTNMKSSRIFSPAFKTLSFPCKVLRIDVDCTASKSYVEIDAIKITGKKQSCLRSSKPKRTEQWVSKVISYSSQYTAKQWSASKVIGPPNVYPKYGDIPEAWAQKTRNGEQYIKVSFPKKIYIERILIYETFHAGGVVSVYAKPPNGKSIKIWQTNEVSNIESSRIFSPDFPKLLFPSNELFVKVNCTGTGPSHYVEIDAIKIIGTTEPGTQSIQLPYEHPNKKSILQQWVSRVVNYSSQYDTKSWPASSIVGKPRVYPKYGDKPGTWAQKTKDANQFVEVKFAEKIFIEKIDIYETYHAGGVKRILAKRPHGEWYTVWRTARTFSKKTSRIFSPPFKKLTFRCNVLRIEVDCTASRSWVEIDAIKISGKTFSDDMLPAHNDLTNDLAKLVNNPMFSDIQFDVNGVKFLAHRAILFVRSEYFRAKFDFDKNGLKPRSPIVLKDMESGVFAVVLHYVYTHRLPPFCSTHVLPSVWRTADRFAMDGLKALAILKLKKSLTVDNVIYIYQNVINGQPVIDNMKEVCEKFLQNHMAEVMRHKTFKNLGNDFIAELARTMG